MISFKYISVGNQQLISDKLYDYVIQYTNILEKELPWNTLDLNHVLEFIPELKQELEKVIDAKIIRIAIIHRKPQFQGSVHVDGGKLTRVLWPVRNCTGSYTKFFDLNGNKFIEKLGSEGEKFSVVEDIYPLQEIASVELIRPIIFDSGIPHGVYTNPEYTEPRLSATVAFSKDLKYLLGNK